MTAVDSDHTTIDYNWLTIVAGIGGFNPRISGKSDSQGRASQQMTTSEYHSGHG